MSKRWVSELLVVIVAAVCTAVMGALFWRFGSRTRLLGPARPCAVPCLLYQLEIGEPCEGVCVSHSLFGAHGSRLRPRALPGPEVLMDVPEGETVLLACQAVERQGAFKSLELTMLLTPLLCRPCPIRPGKSPQDSRGKND